MNVTAIPPELALARERFYEMVAEHRPDLHRYCSRLVGSAIDGEDVVQEALAKAFYALSLAAEAPPALKPWLLRIAHNTAIDFLRRYERRFVEPNAELGEEVAADEPAPPDLVRAALSSFVELPVLQRSAVILKDVLGCSIEEIAETSGASVPAVKSALLRGRAALREQGSRERRERREARAPAGDRALLARYAALFNARDWEGVQSLLAEECRLDLVSRAEMRGKKQISGYFGRYAKVEFRVEVGAVEGRDVLGVFQNGELKYIIAIEGTGGQVTRIRDWRYVSYLVRELELVR
jgi:RNA polymerase sigma-70 factor (ECF subfamily)